MNVRKIPSWRPDKARLEQARSEAKRVAATEPAIFRLVLDPGIFYGYSLSDAELFAAEKRCLLVWETRSRPATRYLSAHQQNILRYVLRRLGEPW